MLNIFKYLLLVFFLATQCCIASVSLDIKNAFERVTNNSASNLDKIIDKMYHGSEANRDFQFKLPNNLNANNYTMVTMKRSDFEQPTFPNLTTNRFYMLMQKRRYSLRMKPYSSSTEWSDIGLDGWVGELTPPYAEWEKNLNFEVGAVELNYALLSQSAESDNDAADDLSTIEGDDNIFIARANDPFGQSTMWPKKPQNASTERVKRDVVKLYSMIKCSTGCNPLSYKGYGCFCGFLGAGYPVDGIDRCCKFHDKCYEQSNCISYLEYFVPYLWKCYRGKPLCAFDHGEWGGRNSCAARLCYCDLQLSRCLRKFTCPRHRAVCKSSPARQLRNIFFRK